MQLQQCFATIARVAARGFGLTAAWTAAMLFLVPASADPASDYRIGPGDVLEIAVFESPGLSGQFRVGADGSVGYPLLGRIALAGKTLSQAETVLQADIGAHVVLPAPPTVTISSYAPVLATGAVERPGPYEFRPGMIALELVALAGGLRSGPSGSGGAVDLIAADQRLTELRMARFVELVRRERLLAEIGDRPLDLSGVPEGLVPPDQRRTMIANEQALFETRNAILAGQKRALEAQRESFDVEIAALEESIALRDEEIDLLEREVGVQQGLFDRGLSVQSKVLDLKREFSSIRREAVEARSFLARAQQRRLQIDQQLHDLTDARMRENVEMLRETDIALARLDEQIGSAWSIVGDLRQRLNDPALATEQGPELSIVREVDGARAIVSADAFSVLEPRDILRVDARVATRTGGAASLPVAAAARPVD